MELCIRDASGLPEHAMLSVRVGETKRQGLYKNGGKKFSFPDTGRVSMTVDVYQWLGRTCMCTLFRKTEMCLDEFMVDRAIVAMNNYAYLVTTIYIGGR